MGKSKFLLPKKYDRFSHGILFSRQQNNLTKNSNFYWEKKHYYDFPHNIGS